MANFLVVTAIGTDRPGIVNELTKLVKDAQCNIVDSRMAIFGNEFTLILLLSGEWNAITRFEATLSTSSAALDLITMMKRTSEHQLHYFPDQVDVTLWGPDAPNSMSEIAAYLAEQQLDLSHLKTHATSGEQQIQMIINIPESISLAQVKTDLEQLAGQLNLTCQFALDADNN